MGSWARANKGSSCITNLYEKQWYDKFMAKKYCLLLILLFCGLGACSTKSIGLSKSKLALDKIEVLDIDMQEGRMIAVASAMEAFNGGSIAPGQQYIKARNRNFMMGDVDIEIEPHLVKEISSNEVGVIYEVSVQGIGVNASMAPGYASTDFFEALNKICDARGISRKVFGPYEILDEKGFTASVGEEIPLGMEEFKQYLSEKSELGFFEGVWTTPDKSYTVGLLLDSSDPIVEYVGVVLDSKYSNWSPGEIKIKFQKLTDGGISLGTWHMRDKSTIEYICEASETLIMGKVENAITIGLLKLYPRSESKTTIGQRRSGTCWQVATGVFVTNAHVVVGADTIKIGSAYNDSIEAVAEIIDERLDIAVLRVLNPIQSNISIPIAVTPREPGEQVFVLGYPLISMLGNELKITSGMINSTQGIRGDTTRFQISAQVQPGNSGGPVINENGDVCGIVVSKIRSEFADGVSFAIKSDYLKLILSDLSLGSIPTQVPASDEKISPSEIFQLYETSVLPVWAE